MQKKSILFVVLTLFLALPAHAVLKERDIANTLSMLRVELTNYHNSLERESGVMKEQRLNVMKQIITAQNKSQQNALMLYSQKNGYVFDLTYACHEATEQYKEFKHNAAPFNRYIENVNVEIARYDSLINDLSSMYVNGLTDKSKIDRNVCLTYAINIRHTLSDNRDQMKQYVQLYTATEKQLRNLNDYAQKRYLDIQNTIFSNSGENYITILTHLNGELQETSEAVKEKYRPIHRAASDWDIRVLFWLLVVILIYIGIAAAINYFVIGFAITRLVKKGRVNAALDKIHYQKEKADSAVAWFQEKRTYIITAATVVTFAVLLAVLRATWEQNFFVMAASLLIEFAWLIAAILISLLIRLDAKQIGAGLRIYLPIMVMCFIVILFRITLTPNVLVQLVFPPLLIACAILQWVVIKRYQKMLPKSDMFYTYSSQLIFVTSIIASCVGYTLLSVEILIWWSMQLTCILTITCVASILKRFGNAPTRRYFDAETPITRTWFFRFCYNVVLPSTAALSVILAIYMAADVFNLSDTTWRIFNMKLVDSQNFTFSIFRVAQGLVLFFIFSYINHTALDLLNYNFWQSEQAAAKKEGRKADKQSVVSKAAMWKNVIQVVVWGSWLLITMAIFNINNSWLVAISAGLSTGIGFAMKDILENIYYGISLMAGRIRVGDYISIDGTRGTVKSISYTSTMLEALDGSVIAFQNSQLFTKNYKNLTRNHGNELAIIPVGVAYGSNVAQVKQVIADAVKKLERRNYIKYVNVILSGFGDNSVDFKILAWVDSRKQVYAESDIMEAVYNTLNDHNIEIPFPQRDLHIVSDTAHAVQHADSVAEAEQIISGKTEDGDKSKGKK